MSMIKHSLSRTELLVGTEGIEKLRNSKVVVFGVGGVGSFVVEALTRAGVGELIIVDNDTVCIIYTICILYKYYNIKLIYNK